MHSQVAKESMRIQRFAPHRTTRPISFIPPSHQPASSHAGERRLRPQGGQQ